MGIRMSKGGEHGTESGSSEGIIDLSKIDDLLYEIKAEKQGPRPEGFTVEEYCNQANMSRSGALKRLQLLVKHGKLKSVKWKFPHGQRNVYQYTDQQEQANGAIDD